MTKASFGNGGHKYVAYRLLSLLLYLQDYKMNWDSEMGYWAAGIFLPAAKTITGCVTPVIATFKFL